MSRQVTIPDVGSWYEVSVNGKTYGYPGGTVQEVPDEVAAVIATAGRYPGKTGGAELPFRDAGKAGAEELTAYAKTADTMPKAAAISGYDAAKVQTLTNDSGTVKWVSAPEEA